MQNKGEKNQQQVGSLLTSLLLLLIASTFALFLSIFAIKYIVVPPPPCRSAPA
jgi:hypothetical protein